MKYRNHIIITVVVIAGLFLLDGWFTKRFQANNLYKTQWIIHKEKQSYDYAVLGASHAYMGFDIEMADSTLGMKGINIALDGSHIGTQSVLADLFFRRNENKAKYLFICLDNPQLANSELQTDIADGRMIPFLNYDEVFAHYKTFGKKWYFDRYLPFWKYAEYNYYWGPHILSNTYFNYMKQDFDSTTGARYSYSDKYDKWDTTEAPVNFDEANASFKYLNKVLDICKEKKIKPVLFVLPLTLADTSAAGKAHVASFSSYCEKKGLDFIYIGDYLNYQYEYFSDKGHLNKKGASKSTALLLQLLKEKQILNK